MRAERQPLAAVAVALWTLIAGLIGLYLVLFALMAATRIARPIEEFTYGESWLLDGARRVAQGSALYAPANELPIMHIAYTPLYYFIVGELQRIVGDHGYVVGRGVSLVATLIGALALGWALRRLTGHTWVGLLGIGLFLTQNVTLLLWGPLERADPLALGLTLVGLALVIAQRPSLAALVFLAAVFSKQTFVAAPLATAVALWPCRASFLRFAAIFCGGLIALVVAAQELTQGWFLWHTVTANSNQPDLQTFASLLGSFLQYNGLPVLAAFGSFALPAPSFGERIWRLYFVAALLTLPSIAKLGASSNYWLELSAATAALLALASCRLAAWPAVRLVAPTMIAGSLLIAVPAYQATAVEVSTSVADLLKPATPRYVSLVSDGGAAPYRVETGFIDRIAREPGALLTDNSGLAAAAGKQIMFEFQIFQLLQAEGRWAEHPILDAIAARRFALVALMHPLDGAVDGTRWTLKLQSALKAAYVADGSEAGFWLYRPRQ